MLTVVIDASAAGAILFAERRRDDVLREIDGRNLIAPALIRHEVASIALKKGRARPDERDGLLAAARQYAALRVIEHTIVAAAVVELALDTGLTAYDASYLWLARTLQLPLVTLDGDLAEAALAIGVNA